MLLSHVPKRPDAKLYPSEVVTLALRFALKGVGTRAFSRGLTRDSLALFPRLPERTRLFRLFKTHAAWMARFLVAPTVLGVADSDGIELVHPMREGRSPRQVGKKGKSNHRWIVGGKRCFVLHQGGGLCLGLRHGACPRRVFSAADCPVYRHHDCADGYGVPCQDR